MRHWHVLVACDIWSHMSGLPPESYIIARVGLESLDLYFV
jgi:hypothetical protein